MIVNEREFPVVVQAYQSSGNQELFVAEQVVNTQTEVDSFASRYAGFVIKARMVNETELQDSRAIRQRNKARRGSGAAAWALILLLLVALIVVGFTTGWIQKTFDLNLDRIETHTQTGATNPT